MSFENKFKKYKETVQFSAREEKIQETINMVKENFYDSEKKKASPYSEFLLAQFKVIEKKWWVFQLLLLMGFWFLVPYLVEVEYLQRSMGIVAVLFIVLVIPELWKNRKFKSMEIEAASYYSLREIYSARMMLFGTVDVFLITMFCGVTAVTTDFALRELLVNFLFPMVVTACICFGVLSSKHHYSEFVSIGICVIWSAVWWLLVLNETIYTLITLPVWLILFGSAVALLLFIIYRTLKNCNYYWEVNLNGVEG